MARCSFAQWMPLPWTAGPYVNGPFKIVHHTTVGSTAEGAFATYNERHFIPHFTVDDRGIYQHVDTDVAVTALEHRSGTAETNRSSAVQFEVVGFADRPKKIATLFNVGRLCRWIEQTHAVPPVWPNGYPNPPKNGQDPGGHNRNEANWLTKGGHYGHCHVPNNSHWDPGYTKDEVEYIMGVTATDAVQVGEAVEMPDHMAPQPTSAMLGSPLLVLARSGLRLRAGPGTEYDILQLIPFGTRVQSVKVVGDWTQVDLQGDGAVDGFVSSHFLGPAQN